jgi:LacI family transcriptional regulator
MALRGGRTGMIGFWMCLGYSRYRSQVADQMQRILFDAGFSMAVTDVDNEYIFKHSLSRVLRMPVDGIIAFDGFASAGAYAEHCRKFGSKTPFVSMGAYWSEELSYVGVDLRKGAQEAAEHLVSTGRKSIAYLAPWNSGLLTDGDRFEGYRDKMIEHGMEVSTISVESSAIDSIEASLRQRILMGSMPDGILCVNDDLAMDAVFALERLGLKAGRDVALVGFNGTEGTERGACPLTTVKQPIEEMCALAYRYLKTQMEDAHAPVQQKILNPELIIRNSSTR